MALSAISTLNEIVTMKKMTFKTACASAVLLAVGTIGTASAHTVTGTVAAGKVDIVNFQCFADTNLSTAADGTTSNAAGQQVYIDVTAGTVTATVGHIDMTPPANQHWTGQVSTTGIGVLLTPPAGKTAGIWNSHGYNLSVTNATASPQTYAVNYHCQRTTGAHTGTGALIASGTADPTVDYTLVIDN
jgi:hypothetical protein